MCVCVLEVISFFGRAAAATAASGGGDDDDGAFHACVPDLSHRN